MNKPVAISVLFLLSHLAILPGWSAETATITINTQRWHLGTKGNPEWDDFASDPPTATPLELKFQAQASDGESTLFIRQDDVRQDWFVQLNGKRLGRLFLMEEDLVTTLTVPAGVLRDGENKLEIIPRDETDDIVINQIWLKAGAPVEVLSECLLDVAVVDAASNLPIPARVTIVDGNGALAAVFSATGTNGERPVALRPGVAYIGPGGTEVGLLAGDYTVYANRGFEYGVDTKRIRLAPGDSQKVRLSIRREVPTPGLVSCDTHIHTFTHSGHGDATTEERMLTLAGEGLELPVATDHNSHTDYRDPAVAMGVSRFFTPVGGNEVTTVTAHFNVFPVEPDARIPDFRIGSWPALIETIRATPDVKVVVMNHPLNVHNNFQPFAATNYNNVTGEHLRGAEYSFDAIELLNSSAQQSDYMAVYSGWFAMLNYGYRIFGVGSSDGHDVSRYIVGQGRTYISVPDEDASRIDITRACESLVAGRASVSMGLLVDLKVNDRFGIGDLATDLSDELAVTARVLGPSWVEATNVTLFANGKPIFESPIQGSAGKPGEKASVTWKFKRPAHDVHLVAIATGPGVEAPYWAIPRPYQPTSKHWDGRVIGSTNPIWLDADRDGRFTAARVYAKQLVDRAGTEPGKLVPALASYDEAVAAQAASLCRAAGKAIDSGDFQAALAKAPEPVRKGFQAYAATIGD